MRRRVSLALLVPALVAAAASVSYRGARTFELTDAAGSAIDRVYLAFQYRGSLLNPVHPVTYNASALTVVRSSAPGRVDVPGAWHLHAPFPLKTPPSLWIELVYVPRLHNASGHLNEASPSLGGVFVIAQPGVRATVFDLSDRPELWEGTLRNLSSIISRLIAPPVEPDPQPAIDRATAALTRELIGELRQEVATFRAKYGAVERKMPEMPPYLRSARADEQKRWADAVATQLHHEPTWGLLIDRLFTDELEYYERWAADTR